MMSLPSLLDLTVAPVRERGLKSCRQHPAGGILRRSREGAWIEIIGVSGAVSRCVVAPVRERGLKSSACN